MVGLFLLRGVRQQGLRPRSSGRHQTLPARPLKATDLCAIEPERAAQGLIDAGFTPRYDYALQTLIETPYDRWRDFDAEDTMRFFALRLHEVDMIKSSPNALLAEGTDWRFLNELKRELKA